MNETPAGAHRFAWIVAAVMASVAALRAQDSGAKADTWITNSVRFPPFVETNSIRLTGFESLKAEALAGKLKVCWSPAASGEGARAIAVASFDAPGHWPARDWRRFPMQARGNRWEAALPVEDLDVPVVYFIEAKEPQGAKFSLMRVCQPRLLGLEMPSRIPWPFLEGFEQGAESWHLVSDDTSFPPLTVSAEAHDGHGALSVKLPADKRSVTVATPRLRGWQIRHHFATGLSLWLRAHHGAAKARFTLFANARTERQVASVCRDEIELATEWRQVRLLFQQFPQLPPADVDLLAIEFIGVGPGEFLVDDLELIGRGSAPPQKPAKR